MSGTILIIDGNNLLHADPQLAGVAASNFDLARARLVRKAEGLAGNPAYARITVVFDGRTEKPQSDSPQPGVYVIFAPADMTADTVIERMVHAAPDPKRVLVVTSDKGERDTVEAAGATSMGCTNFLELLEKEQRRLASRVRNTRTQGPSPTLGDFFPGRK